MNLPIIFFNHRFIVLLNQHSKTNKMFSFLPHFDKENLANLGIWRTIICVICAAAYCDLVTFQCSPTTSSRTDNDKCKAGSQVMQYTVKNKIIHVRRKLGWMDG